MRSLAAKATSAKKCKGANFCEPPARLRSELQRGCFPFSSLLISFSYESFCPVLYWLRIKAWGRGTGGCRLPAKLQPHRLWKRWEQLWALASLTIVICINHVARQCKGSKYLKCLQERALVDYMLSLWWDCSNCTVLLRSLLFTFWWFILGGGSFFVWREVQQKKRWQSGKN